jgi:hypothetical protein
MTAHVQLTERESDWLRNALHSIQTTEYPEEMKTARRAAFLAMIDRRNREAYLLAIVTGAIEPDDASDIPTDGVTEAEDERNSRPSPF